MTNFLEIQIQHAAKLIRRGELIAYPTEAVYGLGCDPFNQQAVEKLFHVKQRPIDKGLILVAASVDQIEHLVKLKGCDWQDRVMQTWPGPYTWILPTKKILPEWITGGRETIAIRVSAHPVVQSLCNASGGVIVSTSANLTGLSPAKSCLEIQGYFKDSVYCIDAPLGELEQPTEIWDAQANYQVR
jgi:L-threonylcarbamoyladenylate synthase